MSIDMLAAAAAAAQGFDVEAATRAYLDTLQGAARAKSDAYFEGGYWLLLWSAAGRHRRRMGDAPLRLVGGLVAAGRSE